MKKTLVLLLIIFFVVGTAGCSSKEDSPQVTPVEISAREIEQMPGYIEEYLKDLQTQENYAVFNVEDGLLVFAARGEMNTGGYTISFDKAGISDDKLFVEVTTSDPGQGEASQAITYPYALGKILGRDLPGQVVFVEGTDYSKIIKEVSVTEIPQPEESVINLYFGTQDGYLRKEPRLISGLPAAERGQEVVQELIKGSESGDDTLNVLPEGTEVLDYQYDQDTGLAVVNLSDHVHAVAGSMGETLAVYSIVNSLTELPGIEQVKILIEGEEAESIAGHVYLGDPLVRDLEFLEGNMLK
ncbi:MAG: GerMN domain-containing protein [Peptococcaceae bacterium]